MTKKKVLKWILVPVISICLVGVLGIIYSGTNHFHGVLEKNILEQTGYQVKFNGKIKLRKVYPQLSLSSASLTVLSPESQGSSNRIRLDDLSVSVPTKLVMEGSRNGKIELNAGILTAITSTTIETEENPASTKPREIVDFEKIVTELSDQLDNLEISVRIQRLDYISRNVDSPSTRHRLFNTEIDVDAYRVTGGTQFQNGENKEQIALNLITANAEDSNPEALTGNLSFNAIDYDVKSEFSLNDLSLIHI